MEYFADTWFWIALINMKDQHHERAMQLLPKIADARLITSEMVLTELLNMYAGKGQFWRAKVLEYVEKLKERPDILIFEQTHEQFVKALNRYSCYLDKEWGLTDCASFLLMEERSIQSALTDDRHFEQAGFTKVA
jgi:predicted nucleic acid-binding protein